MVDIAQCGFGFYSVQYCCRWYDGLEELCEFFATVDRRIVEMCYDRYIIWQLDELL